VHAAQRRGIEEVDSEVAIRHRVHGVRKGRVEVELGRGDVGLEPERVGCQRAGPQGADVGRHVRGSEPGDVPYEREAMSKHMERQADGLPALQMRVAGHQSLFVSHGERADHLDQAGEQVDRASGGVLAPEPQVGGHEVVPASSRVYAASDTTEAIRQRALDERVHVLVVGPRHELPARPLVDEVVAHLVQRIEIGGVHEAGLCENARVRLGRGGVVREEPEVGRDRRRVRHHLGVGAAREPAAPQRAALARFGRGTFVRSFLGHDLWFTSVQRFVGRPQSRTKPAASAWSNVSPSS
jgi:hypothetical protein